MSIYDNETKIHPDLDSPSAPQEKKRISVKKNN